MARHPFSAILILAVLMALPAIGSAFVTGHHGGLIINCTAPIFFEESPARDAKVGVFRQFSFTASDNTDPLTLKAWINNQPVAITVTRQRSGRYTVEGILAEPITQGRAWIKATGVSDDGCDQLHTWNVYAGH